MPRIEAIIFDKDGTLFDFAASWGGWAVTVLDHIATIAPDAVGDVATAIGFDPAARVFQPESVVIAGSAADVAVAAAPYLPAGLT